MRAYHDHTNPDSLVDPQTPDIIRPLVENFLDAEFAKLKSKNTMDVKFEVGILPWVGEKNHWNFQAADAATRVRTV
jgi:Cys-Gly metallodipeptidase DUG1